MPTGEFKYLGKSKAVTFPELISYFNSCPLLANARSETQMTCLSLSIARDPVLTKSGGIPLNPESDKFILEIPSDVEGLINDVLANQIAGDLIPTK